MNTILKEQLAREEGFEEGVQVGDQRGEKRGIEIGQQRGIEIGQKRGIQKGEINATIKLCKEFGLEEDKIISRLIKKFNLLEEQAKKYFEGEDI